ncbi:MAG: hypothetical protein R6V86_09175 [Spirochaetia bacterium]
MKQLTLLRHAKAEPNINGIEDFQRQIVHTETTRISEIAKRALEAWGRPDIVISSPAVRAAATAKLFAKEVAEQKEIKLYDQLYAAETDDIFEVVRELPAEATYAVLVGHNPSLEEFAFLLLKEQIQLKPGECINFSIAINRWEDFSITKTPRYQQLIMP